MVDVYRILGVGAALVLGCGPGNSGESGHAGSETSGPTSTGPDSTTGDPYPSLLELCAAPEPCDSFGLAPGGFGNEEVNPALECAVSRALESIADGSAVELSSESCDIGCVGTDLLFVGDGTVYVQWTMKYADTTYESISRCTVQPASFFEACLGQPPAGDCINWGVWGTDCVTVDDVQCP